MSANTWFFPPNFELGPNGEVALGTVIADFSKPTHAIVSLKEHPSIRLPDVENFPATYHDRTVSASRSFSFDLMAKVLDIIEASGRKSLLSYESQTIGKVDVEVREFCDRPSEDALKAIVDLPKVRDHMCVFYGHRPIYIITGLLVAQHPFDIKTTTRSSGSISAGSSVMLHNGAAGSRGAAAAFTTGKTAATGVVYAYSLHQIQLKRKETTNYGLFAHPSAFASGRGRDDEKELEVECVDAAAQVLKDDGEFAVMFVEHPISSGGSLIVFDEAC